MKSGLFIFYIPLYNLFYLRLRNSCIANYLVTGCLSLVTGFFYWLPRRIDAPFLNMSNTLPETSNEYEENNKKSGYSWKRGNGLENSLPFCRDRCAGFIIGYCAQRGGRSKGQE